MLIYDSFEAIAQYWRGICLSAVFPNMIFTMQLVILLLLYSLLCQTRDRCALTIYYNFEFIHATRLQTIYLLKKKYLLTKRRERNSILVAQRSSKN